MPDAPSSATTATDDPHEGRTGYVGTRQPRLEDRRYLTGSGKYLDDVTLPRMLHAAFVRSPHAHARILSIRTDEAARLPGVVRVFTPRSLETEIPELATSSVREEILTCKRRVLPLDKVRHVGEAVVAVVAESRYIAEDACELVEIDWEPLPVVVDVEKALSPEAPILDEELGQNQFAYFDESFGDVDDAFANATHVFRKRFHHGRYTGAPLETKGVIGSFDRGSGQMTIWTSTQSPWRLRSKLAAPLGLSESKIRIIVPDVGGAYGVKAHVPVEEVMIPAFARLVGRPVKWVEDRWEHLAACCHAKEQIIYLEIAVDDDGTFRAFRGRYIGDGGAYSAIPFTSAFEPLDAGMLLPSIYDIEACGYVLEAALTNKCMIGTYRGVGWTAGQCARESLIDDIAHALDLDPLELRLKNCIPSTPFTSITGMGYDGGSYAESMEKARELIGYAEFRERQAELRDEGRFTGIGFSPYVEPTGWGSKISATNGIPAAFTDSVTLSMEPDGAVTISCGFGSQGQGHETSLAQVAADELGARIEDVTLRNHDTDRPPFGMGTFASRIAVVYGGAIRLAAAELREKLKLMAAHMLEADSEDIELGQSAAAVRGAPESARSFTEIAQFAYFDPASRDVGVSPELIVTKMYDPEETYGNGTIVAVVDVDVETGQIRIERLLAVEDCGVMLNPMIVDGQMLGAIAQGIGGALYENLVYDEDGGFRSGTLVDYLYPSMMEVPHIEIEHLVTPSPVTEGGIKGAAEGGILAAPAAIVNAVGDALRPMGVTIDRTPLGPSDVLELLEAAADARDAV